MTELFTGGTGACHRSAGDLGSPLPVLEVAEDNQTAKGIWMSTGAILMLHDGDRGGPLPSPGTPANMPWTSSALSGVGWYGTTVSVWRTDFDHDPVANAAPHGPWARPRR